MLAVGATTMACSSAKTRAGQNIPPSILHNIFRVKTPEYDCCGNNNA
jgi:hypothetical protein